MAESIADLNIALRATGEKLAADINAGIGRAQSQVGVKAIALGNVIADGISKGIGKVTETLKSAIGNSLKLAADFETISTSFRTLVGDAAKADSALQSIRTLGANTPFEFTELADAGRKLIAFGEDAANVTETLRRIGEVSAGVSAPIGEIAEIYGKARVQGRLFAEDINQLTGRGIPIIQELAKQFGVADSEVKKLIESGKVGFPQLEQAFINLTSNGGKFSGQMEALSRTTNGIMSNLKDTINGALTDVGTGINAALRPLMADLSAQLAVMSPTIRQIGQDFGTWLQGIYQTQGGIKDMTADAVEFAAKIADWALPFKAFKDLVVSGFVSITEMARNLGVRIGSMFAVGQTAAIAFFELLKVKLDETKNAASQVGRSISDFFNPVQKVQRNIASGKDAYGRELPEGAKNVYADTAALPTGGTGGPDATLLGGPPPQDVDYTAYNTAVEDLAEARKLAGEEIANSSSASFDKIVDAGKKAMASIKAIGSEKSPGDSIREAYSQSVKDSELKQYYDEAAQSGQKAMEHLRDWMGVPSEESKKLATEEKARQASVASSAAGTRARDTADFVTKLNARQSAAAAAASNSAALASQEASAKIAAANQAAQAIEQANAKTYSEVSQLSQNATTDIVTAWATGTGKISDIVSRWAQSMIRQFIQVSLWGNKSAGGSYAGILGGLGGASGGGGGSSAMGWVSAIGSLFGGFGGAYANGGRPPMGKVSVVGERGPELFVPDSAGRIVPNNVAASMAGVMSGGGASGGGEMGSPVIVNQTFSTGVTHADLAGMMDEMEQRTRDGVIEAKSRGGAFRRGLTS